MMCMCISLKRYSSSRPRQTKTGGQSGETTNLASVAVVTVVHESNSTHNLLLVQCNTVYTVDQENFAVKVISWSRSTVKIKHAKN